MLGNLTCADLKYCHLPLLGRQRKRLALRKVLLTGWPAGSVQVLAAIYASSLEKCSYFACFLVRILSLSFHSSLCVLDIVPNQIYDLQKFSHIL